MLGVPRTLFTLNVTDDNHNNFVVSLTDRYSVYLLYWYKSANTDAEDAAQQPSTSHLFVRGSS